MLENSYPKEVVHEELILYCIDSSSSESVELIELACIDHVNKTIYWSTNFSDKTLYMQYWLVYTPCNIWWLSHNSDQLSFCLHAHIDKFKQKQVFSKKYSILLLVQCTYNVIMCPTLYFCLIIHYYNVYINNTWLMYMYFHFFFPLGSTPLGTYKKLIEFHKAGALSFKYVKTFNMDEYVGQ